ncbi:MAG TPA: neutral zinc metallopeptidase [Hyphomicrobiaceae bacterium]|nr:neutral zinc metallopeptidase [Hyphomicrobiaceae bacterium]
MRYDDQDRESRNVEDRRGEGGGGMFGGGRRGMPIPIPMGGRGGMSITTMLIIGVIMLLFGINPLDILRGDLPGGGQGQFPPMPRMDQGGPAPRTGQSPFEIPGLPGGGKNVSADNDEMLRFVKRVVADTEDVWNKVFQSFGKKYEEPKLVVFNRAFPTACGTGMAAMGPFYCPLDRKIYIDLSFYEELKRRFQAPGDFAQAYVIAHEVGHHVQTLLGIADAVQRRKQSLPEREANRYQVMMELQADCLAGVWASLNHQLKNRLEEGDIQEGLRAAAAIGDDMIQRQQTGRVVPDAFTHGSSEQRMRWFRRGLETSQIQQCDTFNAPQL